MPTQSSGPISFANLNSFFGTGTPVSINEFYRAGTYVPNISPNNHVPTSGAISLQELYDTWALRTLAFTVTVGSISAGKGKGTYYGFGSGFGSLSNGSFISPNGTLTIQGLFFNTNNNTWNLQLSCSGSAPDDTDLSFTGLSVSGYPFTGSRSARSATSVNGTTRQWTWTQSGTAHPTSGTISCSLTYCG